jgi:hypothetical protein
MPKANAPAPRRTLTFTDSEAHLIRAAAARDDSDPETWAGRILVDAARRRIADALDQK